MPHPFATLFPRTPVLTAFAPLARPDRPTLGRLVSESTLLLMVSIGSIILVLALLILFHQNANATKGYMLRTLERERSELLLEEEVLKMQVADAQALGRLADDHQIQAMVAFRNPVYLQTDATVAALPEDEDGAQEVLKAPRNE